MSLDADLAELLGVAPPVRWARRPEVEKRTCLSRSEIYRRMGEGEFPRPRTLSVRKVVWNLAEVDAWMAAVDAKAAG